MTTETRAILISWGVATMIALVRLRTPEQWANLAVTNPRIAGFVKIARGAGFDLHAVVEGLAMLVLGQRPAAPAARAIEDAAAPLLIATPSIGDRDAQAEPAKSGAPNVTVYATVSGSDAARQIARRVVDIIAERARNPTGSSVLMAPTGRADKTPAESEANAAPAPLPIATSPYPGHEVPPLPSVPELIADAPAAPVDILAPVQLAPVVAPLADLVVELVSSLPRDPAPYDHRVQGLIKLMAAGKYAGKTTDEDLATLWGIEPAEVTRVVQKAAASLTAALPPPPAAPVVVGPLAVPADVAPVVLTVISTP